MTKISLTIVVCGVFSFALAATPVIAEEAPTTEEAPPTTEEAPPATETTSSLQYRLNVVATLEKPEKPEPVEPAPGTEG